MSRCRRNDSGRRFGITDQEWNARLGQADRGRTTTLHDRRLPFGDESVRFTFEHLPRWSGEGANSTPESFAWGGPVVVRAHYRGRSQVIAELGALDGGLRVAIGSGDSGLLLRIDYLPHYNNSFRYDWAWKEDEGRFVRLEEAQEQGC